MPLAGDVTVDGMHESGVPVAQDCVNVLTRVLVTVLPPGPPETVTVLGAAPQSEMVEVEAGRVIVGPLPRSVQDPDAVEVTTEPGKVCSLRQNVVHK